MNSVSRDSTTDRRLILIVDDDIEGEMASLVPLLEMEGFRVAATKGYCDTEDICRKLQEKGTAPAVAIIDVILAILDPRDKAEIRNPRLAGNKVTQLVLSFFPETRVILLTVVDEVALPRSLRNKVRAVINRPADWEKILSAITHVLASPSGGNQSSDTSAEQTGKPRC